MSEPAPQQVNEGFEEVCTDDAPDFVAINKEGEEEGRITCEEMVALDEELDDCKSKRKSIWVEYIWKGISVLGLLIGVSR